MAKKNRNQRTTGTSRGKRQTEAPETTEAPAEAIPVPETLEETPVEETPADEAPAPAVDEPTSESPEPAAEPEILAQAAETPEVTMEETPTSAEAVEAGNPPEPVAEAPADAAQDATSATEPAKPSRKRKQASPAAPKKMSALDAADQVLAERGEPMTAPDLIKAMADQGLWISPSGKTPAATLYAAMLREITTKGAASRFTRPERGKFARKAQA